MDRVLPKKAMVVSICDGEIRIAIILLDKNSTFAKNQRVRFYLFTNINRELKNIYCFLGDTDNYCD
jgi:hypothetical protein